MCSIMHLHHLLSEIKNQLPCHYYALHMLETNTIYSDYALEWVDFYKQNHFEKRDQAIIESQKTPLPFYWDYDIAHALPPQKQYVFKKARDFNIHCGTSILNIHKNCVVTLSLKDKNLSLNNFDYLCTTLGFLTAFSMFSSSTHSFSKTDFISLFNDFIKMRNKVSAAHHTPLFQALHHLQISRLYLNQTAFSSEKESAMKYLSHSADLMHCFIDNVFNKIDKI